MTNCKTIFWVPLEETSLFEYVPIQISNMEVNLKRLFIDLQQVTSIISFIAWYFCLGQKNFQLLFYFPMGLGERQNKGAVNFLPKISKWAGEQAEKLPEFPIVLSANLPEWNGFLPNLGGCSSRCPASYVYVISW